VNLQVSRRTTPDRNCDRCSIGLCQGSSVHCPDCNVVLNKIIKRWQDGNTDYTAEALAADLGISRASLYHRALRNRTGMQRDWSWSR
jgi:hypothetical protein